LIEGTDHSAQWPQCQRQTDTLCTSSRWVCKPQCSRCEPQRTHARGLIARARAHISVNRNCARECAPRDLSATDAPGNTTISSHTQAPGAAALTRGRSTNTYSTIHTRKHATAQATTHEHVPHHTSAHTSTTHGAASRAHPQDARTPYLHVGVTNKTVPKW